MSPTPSWLRQQIISGDAVGRGVQVLNLSGLPVKSWPVWMDLSKFPQLRHLDLSSCSLTEVPSAVQRAPTLVALTLQDNPLTSLPEFILDGSALPELAYLNVRRTQIASLPVRLAKLPKLRLLRAGDSPSLTAHQAVHATDSSSLLGYLRELASDDSMQSLDRFRLMFLGPAGVGKSRLLECMLEERGGAVFGKRLDERRDPTVYPVIKHHKHLYTSAESKESKSFHVMFTDPPGLV